MLRITGYSKLSSKTLGDPVGKEVKVKVVDSDTIYVKFGKELSKHTLSSSSSAERWRRDIFATALNHPVATWTVTKALGAMPIVVNDLEKGMLVYTDDNSGSETKVEDGDTGKEDGYGEEGSTVLFGLFNNTNFVFGWDNHDMAVFKLQLDDNNEAKAELMDLTPDIKDMGPGQVCLVEKSNGSLAYAAHENGKQLSLITLSDTGFSTKDKLTVTSNSSSEIGKIFMTESRQILHISDKGLMVYKIDGKELKFDFYCPHFTKEEGWTSQLYNTIQLVSFGNENERLVSSGPKGIEYLELSKECKSFVAEFDSSLNRDEKTNLNVTNVRIAAVNFKSNHREFEVIGNYNSELYKVLLQIDTNANAVKSPRTKTLEVLNKQIKLEKAPGFPIDTVDARKKPVRWLRETFDESYFKNIVDKLSGRLRFSFPMIDIGDRFGLPIRLMAYYEDSDSEEVGVLGRHWTLGKDCIVLDYKDTVFEELHEYFLVKDQVKIKLERSWANTSEGTIVFTIKGKSGVQFRYKKDEDKWKVSNNKVSYTYGGMENSVVKVPAWQNWYGPAAHLNGTSELSVQWNLVEIKSDVNDATHIQFSYNKQDSKSNGIVLNKITDGIATTVDFHYSDLSATDTPKIQQSIRKNVKFHNLSNTKLLRNISIETQSYRQNIELNFKENSFLHSINQEEDSRPILKIDYSGAQMKIDRIKLPSETVLSFDYEKKSVETSTFQQEIDQFADLYSGPGYSLMIAKRFAEKVLKITLKDAAGLNNFVKEHQFEDVRYNNLKIKSFNTYMKQNYFALVVKFVKDEQAKKELVTKIFIFNKQADDTWSRDSEPIHSNRETRDSSFKSDFQDDSFTYFENNTIHYACMELSDKWNYQSHYLESQPKSVHLITRGAVYFTSSLFLVRWNPLGENQIETIPNEVSSLPDYSDTETFFSHIDLSTGDESSEKELSEYKTKFRQLIDGSSIAMYNNMIVVRTLMLNETGHTSMKLHLYEFDAQYKVTFRQILNIDGEDITKLHFKLDVYDEHKIPKMNVNQLDKYTFKFQKSDKKYKLKHVETTDFNNAKTEPSEENKNLVKQYEAEMRIPLDFEKYMMQVNAEGIIVGNQHVFFNGGQFEMKQLDVDELKLKKFNFPVGTHSVLKREDENSNIKLCSQARQTGIETCENLEMSSAHNVSIKYPYYIITQKQNDVRILLLKPNGDGVDRAVEYKEEIVHSSTSHSVLVTTRITDKKTIVRPLKSLGTGTEASVDVVTLEKVTTAHEVYEVAYEYGGAVLLNNDVVFQSAIVIPGGKKSLTGYYNETTNLESNEQVVQVYDSTGALFDPEYVKRMNEKQEEEERQIDEQQVNPNQTIYDKSGLFPLVNTRPFAVEHKLVHFVGFEDYEELEEWNVPPQDIVRNQFSGTGRNFLQIKAGQTFERSFSDLYFNDDFVAGSWIRTTHPLNLGDSTDILKLEVDNDNSRQIQGIVKQLIEDWFYVEANTTTVSMVKSKTIEDFPKLNLKVIFTAPEANEVHLDHIRVSPLHFNFQANVYDYENSQRTAVINNNGYATRFLYDEYSRRVAEIGENGQIKYFASYSKRFAKGYPVLEEDTLITEGSSHCRTQIRPKHGWLETFSPYTVRERWIVEEGKTNLVAPASVQLTGKLTLKEKLSSKAVCVRLLYSLNKSKLTLNIGKINVTLGGNLLQFKEHSTSILESGELVVFWTQSLSVIWIDGVIFHESNESFQGTKEAELSLSSTGNGVIKDLVIMEDPELLVSHMNRELKPLQEIMIQDEMHLLVRQMVYDNIGRKVVETVWTQVPIQDLENGANFLRYQEAFISNDNITNQNSFLYKTSNGVMTGLVADKNPVHKGYPYSQIQYYANPLQIRQQVGKPGEQYSIATGKFSHKFKIESSVAFIKLHYPYEKGYRHEEESLPNGIFQVTVYNRRNKKVAEYVKAKDHKNILTTYVYDDHGNQLQMLPPNYYDEKYKSNWVSSTPETEVIESKWAASATYDHSGRLLLNRTTPDGGRVDFIYNEYNQLRYQLHYDESKSVDKIVYFLYNVFGRVAEAGKLHPSPEVLTQIYSSTKTFTNIPNRNYTLYFDYGEHEFDPSFRGRVQRTVKQNADVHFSEDLFFDEDGNVVKKSFLNPATGASLSIEYLFENDKVSGIRYPFLVDDEPLVLKYSHNFRGEVVGISNVVDANATEKSIVKFDHNAQGMVTRIVHNYESKKFNQDYEYNAPGQLTLIRNDYLKETLYYTEKGYGAVPTGDGSILRTEFHANWHDKCDQNLITLTPRAFVSERINLKLAEICFDALYNHTFMDYKGRPLKTFYPDLYATLPIKCSTGKEGKFISEQLLEKGFPEYYGHAYNYGSHGELIAAKHFVGEEKDDLELPMNVQYFSERLKKVTELSSDNIFNIWTTIEKLEVLDKVKGPVNLFEDSIQENDFMKPVVPRLLLENTVSNFDDSICSKLLQGYDDEDKENIPEKCQHVLSNLKKNSLKNGLKEIFSKHPSLKKDILSLLRRNHATSLGTSPGDVESFKIDSNGNHGLFYTGFKRYELTYKTGKNQIAEILTGTKTDPNKINQIEHDSEGNVKRATHKNIENIEYDPLTQRVSKIEMTDKTYLEFGYDYRGERTLKRVYNHDKVLLSTIYYVRDNKGNCLVEYKLVYPNPSINKPIVTVTAYVYGPLGLVGFFRNSRYYSVLLDHEGSTRLVIHKGQVVAAYDYLPYGQLMRKFGADADAHIAYRYTGQELDEETGLYNYHARIYDPDIGRFYQIDPMEQYPSPYKYAGNSPVSNIDPDGQICITLIIMAIGAIVGAYMGASAANKSWNPANWKWGDKWTWIGMFTGAFMGAFAVYGGAASFGYFTTLFGGSMIAGTLATGVVTVAGALLGAAAATNEWNPAKWDWTSPVVWNGLITGASVSLGIPAGFVGVTRTFYSLVSGTSKIFYGLAVSSGFFLFGYLGGSFANNFNFRPETWDWSSPRTIFGIFEGASTVFVGTATAVKHGALKAHNIVTPGNMKLAWYRINIPAKSYTISEAPFKIILTWFEHGKKVGVQVLKTTSKASLAQMPKYTHGFTKAFFIQPHQMVASAITSGVLISGKSSFYGAFFENNFNKSEKIGVVTTESSKRIRRSVGATSSSSVNDGFLNEVFSFFTRFLFLKNTQQYVQSSEIHKFNRNPESNLKKEGISKYCYSQDQNGNQFTCSQRYSTINVFSKHPSFNLDSFGSDTFSRCLPIHWSERPSVACEGEQSTFIYTPQEPVRMFDYVDGWLLLARVTPAAVRSLREGLRFIKNVFTRKGSCRGCVIDDVDSHKQQMKVDLERIRSLITDFSVDQKQEVQRMWDDLNDDVEEFMASENPALSSMKMLQERMVALEDDILECIQVTTFADISKHVHGFNDICKNNPSMEYFNLVNNGLSYVDSSTLSGNMIITG